MSGCATVLWDRVASVSALLGLCRVVSSYSLTYWFHFAKVFQTSAKLVEMAPNGNQTRERQVRATLLQEHWQHATCM